MISSVLNLSHEDNIITKSKNIQLSLPGFIGKVPFLP